MKYILCSFIVLFVTPVYSQDCQVENLINEMVLAQCEHYESGMMIYDTHGTVVEVVGNDGPKLVLKNRQGVSFQKREPLHYAKPIPVAPSIDPRYPASLDPFDSNFMRVYMTGLRYQHSKLEGDFDSSTLNAEFQIKGGDLKTLPLSFDLELIFDDLGIILSPDFRNDSGAISLYSRNDFLNFGLFFSLNSKTTEETLTINNNKLMSQDENASSITVGFMIREEIDFEKWQVLTDFRLGYFRETSSFNDTNGFESKVTYDAGLATFELDLFYKVSKRFLAGFGFGVGYGFGTIEVEDGTTSLGDDTDLLSFQVNLFQLQLIF